MRKLTRLWRALETVPGLCDVPAVWEHICGEDFPLIASHLRPTDDFGTRYPCPNSGKPECPRRIVDYEDGTLAALCRHPEQLCPRLDLTPKQALVHVLDLDKLLRPMAEPLCIRYQSLRVQAPGLWAAGLSTSRATRNHPVFILCHCGTESFGKAVAGLLLECQGSFVVMAPSGQHLAVELQQRLVRRNCQFIALDERVGLDGEGRFAALEVSDADEIEPTPVAQRVGVIERYKLEQNCTAKAIHEAAGVKGPDFYKWIKGEIADSSTKSRRIEETLRLPLPKKFRK